MDYSEMKAKEVKRKPYSYEKSKANEGKRKPYSYEKSKANEGKRKPYSYEKDLAREAKQAARSMKKSAVSWLIVLVILVIGVVGGFFAHKLAFKNDVYQMVAYGNGEVDICIGVDEQYQTYTELGVKCVSFGKDVSSECTVKYYYRTDLTEEQVEVSEVDETKPGIYYAVYSTNSPKYKTVTLIRNIIVLREEG